MAEERTEAAPERIDSYEIDYLNKCMASINTLTNLTAKAEFRRDAFMEFLDGKYGLGKDDQVIVGTGEIKRVVSEQPIAQDGHIEEGVPLG